MRRSHWLPFFLARLLYTNYAYSKCYQSRVIPSWASADGFSRVLFRIYRYVTNVSSKAILVDEKFLKEQNLYIGHHRAECVTNIKYSESAKQQIWMRVGHEKLYS